MNSRVSIYRVLNFFGLEGSSISDTLNNTITNTEQSYYDIIQTDVETLVKVRIKKYDNSDNLESLALFEDKIRQALGQYLFSINDKGMEDTVGSLLSENRITISVAESCTGGLIGHMLTNVPGSSQYFQGGVVAYSNQVKHDLLKVKTETLEKFGAVSNPTAREMAEGVRSIFKSGLGLSVTGIAGPDGGSREKPVGTVHIGLSTVKDTFFGKYNFKGTRELIKMSSALMALDWVRRYINEDPFLPGL